MRQYVKVMQTYVNIYENHANHVKIMQKLQKKWIYHSISLASQEGELVIYLHHDDKKKAYYKEYIRQHLGHRSFDMHFQKRIFRTYLEKMYTIFKAKYKQTLKINI